LKHKSLMDSECGHEAEQQHGQMDEVAAEPHPAAPSLAAPTGFHFMPGLVRRRPIRILLLATAVVANSYALLRHGLVGGQQPTHTALINPSSASSVPSSDTSSGTSWNPPIGMDRSQEAIDRLTADLTSGPQSHDPADLPTHDPAPGFRANPNIASLPPETKAPDTKAPDAEIKTAADAPRTRKAANVQPFDEVDQYLWGVYQRSGRKKDSSGDFTWKDEAAASRMGLTTKDYVVGGMDRDWKELIYSLGQAMDAAGINWTILSGFRDDYRQGLASGYKAHVGNSFHGGSRATGGYGHGCAADIEASDGEGDANSAVWKFVDQHGEKFGIIRPMKQIDPAHIQPIGGWHDVAFNLRDKREATEAAVLPASADGADGGKPVTTLVDKRSGISEAQFDCVRSHHEHFRVASLSHRHTGHEFPMAGHMHRALLMHGGRFHRFGRRRMMVEVGPETPEHQRHRMGHVHLAYHPDGSSRRM
jgi:hypothetical protein